MRQPSPTAYTRIDEVSSAPIRAEKHGDHWYIFCSFLGHRWFWEQFRQFWDLVDEDKLGPAHRMRHKDVLDVLEHCSSKGELTYPRMTAMKYRRIDKSLLRDLLWIHRGIILSEERAYELWLYNCLSVDREVVPDYLHFTDEARSIIEELTSPVYLKKPTSIKHKPEVIAYELPHPETGVVIRATSWKTGWMVYCNTPEGVVFWDQGSGWVNQRVVLPKERALKELLNAHSPLERTIEITGDSLREMGFGPSDKLEVILRRKVGG